MEINLSKLQERAEKETKLWFEQWLEDKEADIKSYFKSIWMEGFQKGSLDAYAKQGVSE